MYYVFKKRLLLFKICVFNSFLMDAQNNILIGYVGSPFLVFESGTAPTYFYNSVGMRSTKSPGLSIFLPEVLTVLLVPLSALRSLIME